MAKGDIRPYKVQNPANTKLARILHEKKISQSMLLQILKKKGIVFTKASISKYVNGKVQMNIETSKILAHVLGCQHLEEVVEGFPID